MVANQTLQITAASQQAAHFFNEAAEKTPEVYAKYPGLGALQDTMRAELTSASPVEPVPLFGFSMASFAVAHADHSEAFTPSAGGGNSGRGPVGRA